MGLLGRPNPERKRQAVDEVINIFQHYKDSDFDDLSISRKMWSFKKKYRVKNLDDIL